MQEEKYLLKRNKDDKGILCNKVTIDGFEYYVSNEIIKDVRPYKGQWQIEKGYILNKFPTYLTDLSECRLVIATNNPSIDIPQVVNEVERLAKLYLTEVYNDKNKANEYLKANDAFTTKMFFSFIKGYNKSQETHSNSDEDMIGFADWIAKEWSPNGRKGCWDSNELNSEREPKYLVDTTEELLKIWKEQKPKIVYYEKKG